MKTFSIEASIKEGWRLFKTEPWTILGATLISLVLSGRGKFDTHASHSIVGVAFRILMSVIGIIIQIGMIKMFLKIVDGGKASLKELVSHANYFWRYLAVYILYGLLVGAGFILLIIPGVYFMLKYQFAPLFIIDKDTSIMDAFKRSAELSKGVKWKILGFILVVGLLNILGAILIGVGLLVTIPVSMLAGFVVYRTLQKESVQTTAQPSPILPPSEPLTL